jgi:membrane fusion protein (multidrug efflux system)
LHQGGVNRLSNDLPAASDRRFESRLMRMVFLTVVTALALAGCGKQAPPPPPAPEVGYVVLKYEPVTLSTELPGRTAATLQSDVRPQVNGVIKARLFEEGALVRAGQPLYQIDPALYLAARDQAAAQLQQARAAVVTADAKAARYKSLRDIEAVSRQDIDDAIAAAGTARAQVAAAQANLNSASTNLSYTRITAPISGRIGRSAFTAGALVTASQADPLATIQQLDPIYVDITQSSAALVALRRALAQGNVLPASAQVTLKLEDGGDYPFTGRVEFSEVNVDQSAGTVTIRARFPNPQRMLLPGMFVRVMTPQATVPQGILALQDGISRDPKGTATALLVGADGKVEQRTVTAGRAIGDKWLITAGLKPGDKLIVEGTGKARPGAPVRAVPAGSTTPAPPAGAGPAKPAG